MAVIKSQGLQLAIGSTLGTQFTVSAITNASEGVATLSASHGVLANDIILLSSGWKRLNERVVRAKTVSVNDVTLEGIATTSTADYPVGEGIGTGREVTAWTTISQLQPDVGVSGGGFRRSDITQIDDIRAKEIPILAEATSLTFSYFWDSSLSWLSAVESASRAGSVTPFRITIGTTKIYGAGYWGFNSVPSIQNGVLVSSIELSLVSDVTTYTT